MAHLGHLVPLTPEAEARAKGFSPTVVRCLRLCGQHDRSQGDNVGIPEAGKAEGEGQGLFCPGLPMQWNWPGLTAPASLVFPEDGDKEMAMGKSVSTPEPGSSPPETEPPSFTAGLLEHSHS